MFATMALGRCGSTCIEGETRMTLVSGYTVNVERCVYTYVLVSQMVREILRLIVTVQIQYNSCCWFGFHREDILGL